MNKAFFIYILLAASVAFAQNDITNKLGSGGKFSVNDQNDNQLFKVDGSTGDATSSGLLSASNLPAAASSGTGILYNGTSSNITVHYAQIGPMLFQWSDVIGVTSNNFSITLPVEYASNTFTVILNGSSVYSLPTQYTIDKTVGSLYSYFSIDSPNSSETFNNITFMTIGLAK